ncbi:hypothetical protein [Actinomadura chokoriensis]|uniref:Uncharacterized protein n=1 Tax=Actinomadura chokoriensis TaxID=454156 RepID=A0ABV4QUT5_9ACTN
MHWPVSALEWADGVGLAPDGFVVTHGLPAVLALLVLHGALVGRPVSALGSVPGGCRDEHGLPPEPSSAAAQ